MSKKTEVLPFNMHVAKLNETDKHNMISAVDYWSSPSKEKGQGRSFNIAKQTLELMRWATKQNL